MKDADSKDFLANFGRMAGEAMADGGLFFSVFRHGVGEHRLPADSEALVG